MSRMNHIKRFPHCDPRVLHAPGQCQFCDKYPEWQELREMWQIAFTGKPAVTPSDDPHERVMAEGAVLPCPADYIRGDSHTRWVGNRSAPTFTVVENSDIPRGQVHIVENGKVIQVLDIK